MLSSFPQLIFWWGNRTLSFLGFCVVVWRINLSCQYNISLPVLSFILVLDCILLYFCGPLSYDSFLKMFFSQLNHFGSVEWYFTCSFSLNVLCLSWDQHLYFLGWDVSWRFLLPFLFLWLCVLFISSKICSALILLFVLFSSINFWRGFSLQFLYDFRNLCYQVQIITPGLWCSGLYTCLLVGG